MIGGVKTHVLSDTGATHRFCESGNCSERVCSVWTLEIILG